MRGKVILLAAILFAPIKGEAPDANDTKFLECADAARSDYILIGNQRDFPRRASSSASWHRV